MSEETTTQIKYSSYTPAQKRASQLYRQKNKDKINEQRKKYYQMRKEKDPDFLEYKRLKAKEYYEKKKLDKVVNAVVKHDIVIKNILPEQKIEIELVDTMGLLKILTSDKKPELKFDEVMTEVITEKPLLVPQPSLQEIPMPDIVLLQSSKMDVDVPTDASVQLPKPLKGKRQSSKKKVKSDLEKKE